MFAGFPATWALNGFPDEHLLQQCVLSSVGAANNRFFFSSHTFLSKIYHESSEDFMLYREIYHLFRTYGLGLVLLPSSFVLGWHLHTMLAGAVFWKVGRLPPFCSVPGIFGRIDANMGLYVLPWFPGGRASAMVYGFV
nr:hypothetical protein Iba_scaffold1437CG0010 [Ipomoea batatas]